MAALSALLDTRVAAVSVSPLPCNRQHSVPCFRRVLNTVLTRFPGDGRCCVHCVVVPISANVYIRCGSMVYIHCG